MENLFEKVWAVVSVILIAVMWVVIGTLAWWIYAIGGGVIGAVFLAGPIALLVIAGTMNMVDDIAQILA